LNLGDPYRGGAGLPDALQALSLAPPAAAGVPTSIDELVRQLLETLRRGIMPIGVGKLAARGTPGATLQDLKAVMRQAGLLAGGSGVVALPRSRPDGEQPTLRELKAMLQQVGLL
jgi:hypothetical protein